MKLHLLVLPVGVLAGAALLCLPSESRAWTFIGGSLDLNQRDVRVYNNFTDASANDNVTPHYNFPGSIGTPMAMRKSVEEWNSEPSGDGQGDPFQLAIGSGGANFDAYWAGRATSAGTTDQNVVSELAGSGGGVLAFTETPISDGWRILFYSSWDWHDGPGGIPATGNSFDLQGVNCHEYGHALGLGHTPVPGSTMEPSIGSGQVHTRSIESDDIGGVQALYGVKSSIKPSISGVTGAAPLVITGTNFPTANAEVWFTYANPQSPGALLPLRVTGLTSDGTTIFVNVPAAAGAGVVMVRNGASSQGLALSNPFPYDPGACPAPLTYCSGKVTSQLTFPYLSWTGSNSLTLNNLVLECNDALPNKSGIFFYSHNGQAAIPFQGGLLCMNTPISRTTGFVFDVNAHHSMPVNITVFDVGVTRQYQAWFRDSQHPDGTKIGLSDAGQVTFCF
jgi:hypothetical protein